jgi:sulfite exporter TauE/SafE
MMNAAGVTTAEAPRDEGLLRSILRRRRPERSVSFAELVWVHYLRQKELGERLHEPYEGPAEERYRAFEERFEAKHGPIASAYWCTTEASAVALTIKHRPWILPDAVRLHWATDWSTKDNPKLMKILYRCESLAVRVQEVLRDTSQRLATQSLFTMISFVLGFAESGRARNERAVAEVERLAREQLAKIETYYRNAAVRSGQIVYLGGMLLGMIPTALLVVLALVLKVLDPHNSSVRTGILCLAAGSVGALMSVMSRMNSNKVRVDWEFGKDTLRTLGALRPFVGAVFGLMTFFALKSGVVALDIANKDKSTYFYVLFAFAAGFSERLAQDMLLGSTVETAVSRGKRRQEGKQAAEELPGDDELTLPPPASSET